MVRPGLLKTVGQQFDRLSTIAAPDQKASHSPTETAQHPKNIFHRTTPLPILIPTCKSRRVLPGWMQQRVAAFIASVLSWKTLTAQRGTTTLSGMDTIRFGRALGAGARGAAKTLVMAVDAATSPNPSAGAKAKQPADAASTSGKAETHGMRLGQQTARTTAQVRQTRRGLVQGSKRFGEAMWGPLVKLSGVLWLEVTGVFFGIFAIFAASGAWKTRAALYQTAGNHGAHVHLLISSAMAAVFGYFCVSSFVTASRRGRGR
jgi:hypothetical protein